MLIEVNNSAITVCTAADGRWIAYVPDGDLFTVTVDPTSLPPDTTATEEDLTKSVGQSVAGRTTVNFFLGEDNSEISGSDPVEAGWLVPWVSIEGYTYDLVISASAGVLTSDITSAPPGFTNITLPIEGALTVTNTTPSREAPASPGLLSLAAIFPGTSPLCGLQSAWKL